MHVRRARRGSSIFLSDILDEILLSLISICQSGLLQIGNGQAIVREFLLSQNFCGNKTFYIFMIFLCYRYLQSSFAHILRNSLCYLTTLLSKKLHHLFSLKLFLCFVHIIIFFFYYHYEALLSGIYIMYKLHSNKTSWNNAMSSESDCCHTRKQNSFELFLENAQADPGAVQFWRKRVPCGGASDRKCPSTERGSTVGWYDQLTSGSWTQHGTTGDGCNRSATRWQMRSQVVEAFERPAFNILGKFWKSHGKVGELQICKSVASL